MSADVSNFVRHCDICKGTKAPNFIMKPEFGKQILSERPFQRLYIDLLGPYPRSKSGHIGLLIVLDHLTKFHWLHPLRKFTSKGIKRFLEQQIFHVYGVPEVIVSDNGSQFKANDLNAFFTSLGITHVYTVFYSPQSNAAERVNRSLIAGIRSYLKDDHTRWDENLSAVSCALRNSIHSGIKISPYHALFGFDMITHGTFYSVLRRINLLDEPAYRLSKDDNLQLIRRNLHKHLKLAYERNKHYYNLRSRPQSFQVGQEVWRRNFVQSNFEKRLNAKFVPLFVNAKIKEKLGNHYYKLKDTDGKLIGTFHAKDIRE